MDHEKHHESFEKHEKQDKSNERNVSNRSAEKAKGGRLMQRGTPVKDKFTGARVSSERVSLKKTA